MPGKKPLLKHLPCSFHSYSTSHTSGLDCGLTNPLWLDRKVSPQRICLDLSLRWSSCWKRNVFPQRTCPDLDLSWSSCWTWKVFPQRISLDLGLGWYRSNRQYAQGSGKLVLKLPGIRFTAPPHLHPFYGHGAFSSRGRCLATLATHTEEEKGHGRQGWVFLGEQRGLGHSMLDPCPTGFSSFSLGMQLLPPGCLPVRGSQDTKLGLVMGELDAREPETLPQVSALWTRASLTERLGPVHSGHPLWTPGGGAAVPSAHLGLRRWKRDQVVLPTSCPENDKGQTPKVRAGWAEQVLGSHRVPVKRALLLTGSFLAGSPSVLSSHQITRTRQPTARNSQPWPSTIVTICLSCFRIGGLGKEHETNKPLSIRRTQE